MVTAVAVKVAIAGSVTETKVIALDVIGKLPETEVAFEATSAAAFKLQAIVWLFEAEVPTSNLRSMFLIAPAFTENKPLELVNDKTPEPRPEYCAIYSPVSASY